MAKAAPRTDTDLAREMTICVTLPNGSPYAFTLHDVAWFDYDDLLGAVQGQAQRYMVYAYIHVSVRKAHRAAERAARRYFVRAQDGVREALAVGSKAPTETQVRLTIEADPEYRKLQADVERLEDLEADVSVVREGLTQRRDMLASAAMFRAPEAAAKVPDRVKYTLRNRT